MLGLCVGCSSKTDPTANESTPKTPPDAPASGSVVAYSEVQAIFDKNCVGCHGAQNPKEELSLVSHESLMKGGEHGPVVVAGDPDTSILVHALRGTNGKKQMPFGGTPLAEDEIKKVESWIKDGAKP